MIGEFEGGGIMSTRTLLQFVQLSLGVSMFVGAGLVSAGSVVGLSAHGEPTEHWDSVRAVG